jgi:pyruvate formate lyase activating enzyme
MGFAEELRHLHSSQAGDVPLAQVSAQLVGVGELYQPLPDAGMRCVACAHRCTIKPGKRGICQVRYNLGGKLYVPWGYVAALHCDPIEKKPLFHCYPGADVLTFGMLGCDMHCPYCQNWNISQALRDAEADSALRPTTPQEMVQVALQRGAQCIASSYNEPLITSEWAVAIFKASKASGLTNLYVSNGNATREVLEYIRPYTDGYKIDLKSMRAANYRRLGAVLDHILDGIRMVHELGFWLEIVTLVVPGFNDSETELRDIARFIQSVSPDIPWHVTAFHRDYKMLDHEDTSATHLMRSAEIGYEEGLHYVYAGNLPGRVMGYEDTRCPQCHTVLIKRYGYTILNYRIDSTGACPNCGTRIAGMWSS